MHFSSRPTTFGILVAMDSSAQPTRDGQSRSRISIRIGLGHDRKWPCDTGMSLLLAERAVCKVPSMQSCCVSVLYAWRENENFYPVNGQTDAHKKKESASYEKPPLQCKIHAVPCEANAVVKFASTQKYTYKRRCHIIKILVNISIALMAFSAANMAQSNQFHRRNQKVICLKIKWLSSSMSST